MIRLSGNGAAYHIYNGKGGNTAILRLTKSCMGVCGLTGLTDDDDHTVLLQNRFPITELGSQLHTNGHLGQILNHILRRHTYMPGGTAGYNINTGELSNLLIGKTNLLQINPSVLPYRIQGILYSSGLLMNLLHHEMLEAALFRSFRIPGNLLHFFLYFFTIQVIEGHLTRRELYHLQVIDIIHITGIFQNRRYIGRDK